MAPGPAHLVVLAAAAALFMTASVAGHPARFDQRQEGESNIRADVEDVVLLIVPPKDLFAAGMGIATASAANLFKKNHFSDASLPEKWNQKPQTKWTYNSPDKTPFKIDLNKSGVASKKIIHHGDPNRYNINDDKVPVKSVTPSKTFEPVSGSPDKVPTAEKTMTSTTVAAQPAESTTTEKAMVETESGTENKTVKKDLTTEEAKKVASTNPGTTFSLKVSDPKVDLKKQELTTESTVKKDVPKVIGELSPGELGPTSIFSHEGCGPDAYRDVRGICIYKKNSPK